MRELNEYRDLPEVPEKLIKSFFEQTKDLKEIIVFILIDAKPTFLEEFAYSLEDNQKPNNPFLYSVFLASKEDNFNTLREHVEKVRISNEKYTPIVINFDPYRYGRNIPKGFYIFDVLEFLKIYHIPC